MKMLFVLEILFWVCSITVVGTYFGYPAVLLVLSPFRRKSIQNDETPSVTLLISAYNEEEVIREKLENSLALEYPSEKFEIVVISDESSDNTDSIVNSFTDSRIRLFRQIPRKGKSAGLSRFLPEIESDVVVFSDANSIYNTDAIQKLVRNFADSKVGFVVGHQRYFVDAGTEAHSETLYWRYETWLKTRESRLGSMVCGDGAIFAIRRELFEPLREDDINDFIIPLRIINRGFRGIFEPEAICYESTASDVAGEFRRKIRIVNRSFNAVMRVKSVLNPFRTGFFAIQLLIHKVVRWFVPFFLLGAMFANIILLFESSMFLRDEVYLFTFAVQLAFYGIAALYCFPALHRISFVRIAGYFCVVNYAAALGIMQCAMGRNIATWTPERATPHKKMVH